MTNKNAATIPGIN
ncbi:hypothetical protein YPPY29_2253, partial [Yersinia pestis PY-29]